MDSVIRFKNIFNSLYMYYNDRAIVILVSLYCSFILLYILSLVLIRFPFLSISTICYFIVFYTCIYNFKLIKDKFLFEIRDVTFLKRVYCV